MILHTIDPVLFSLGPFSVRYYGIIYALGFVFGYLFFNHLARKRHIILNEDDVNELALYIILGTVIGARLFYVVFYNAPYYLSHPFDVLAVWHGGLSFHGGLLGGVLGIAYFSRKKKVHFYDLTDIISIPTVFGLALGRIGNYLNGELYGRATSVPWCIDYSQNAHLADKPVGCRHPSQLYESLYSFVIFAVLWLLERKNLPRGAMTWLAVAMYGLFRTLAELFRQPDAQLGFLWGGLTMGQLLSIPMFLVGAYMVWRITAKK